jgi:thiosulfate/3-mercaptopyruvate sulfurtransferase
MATPFRLRPSISLCAFRSTTKSRPFFLIQARFESTSAPDASSSSSSSSSQPLLSNFLVTPQALNNALKKNVYSKISTAPRVIPLCAAWFMPNDPQGRNGRAAYLAGHIPRARFFDIDAVCDKNSPYPHMLPSPELFADAMGGLGIRSDDSVVVYDTAELGIFSAPRVAWTLKVFGHHDVHILNNFKLWVDQGFPIEKGEPEEAVDPTNYPVPNLDATKLIGFEELKERVQEQGKDGVEEITIIDARNQGRWEGSSPEPREGMLFLQAHYLCSVI